MSKDRNNAVTFNSRVSDVMFNMVNHPITIKELEDRKNNFKSVKNVKMLLILAKEFENRTRFLLYTIMSRKNEHYQCYERNMKYFHGLIESIENSYRIVDDHRRYYEQLYSVEETEEELAGFVITETQSEIVWSAKQLRELAIELIDEIISIKEAYGEK